MKRGLVVEVELSADYRKYRFPKTFDQRLHALLETRNVRGKLSAAERKEADELVRLSELLTLVRLRAERVANKGSKDK
jgi:hypothetical protein